MFERILTTLDGSEYSDRALPYTRGLATTTGASVHLLSIADTGESPFESTAVEPDESVGRPWLRYLEGAAEQLREDGVPEVSVNLRFGEPARLITEAARDLRADVIIMSTQGLGGDADRQALGSVAMKVLMTAPCPVFMVRIQRPEPPRTVAEERWQGEGGRNVG